MKPVSRWSKTKSLKPLDQQVSNFFITEKSSAVTGDTVQETRGNPWVYYQSGDVLKSLQGGRFHR